MTRISTDAVGVPSQQSDEAPKQNEMRLTLQQKAFINSEAGLQAKKQLTLMVNDPVYNTRVSYMTEGATQLTFVEKHMLYLGCHPKINSQYYLSNLRLKTKIRL